MAELKRAPLGVSGLDKMLDGGLIAGSIALLQGAPGTGKTTLGMQFLYEGVTQHDEAGLLVTFEQFPHTLYRDALAHGWNLRELEQEGKLRVVFTSPQVFLSSLQSPVSPINSAIRDMGVQRAVIDLLVNLRDIDVIIRDLVTGGCSQLVLGWRNDSVDQRPDVIAESKLHAHA